MTERKLFGTDGVRGVANVHPMTVEVAVQLGKAIAQYFAAKQPDGSAPAQILIGKDTRVSGYMFESGLAAGITSMGVNVQLVGPLPTPGIAFLTTGMRADAGIVISASHNEYRDNGIKIFARDGFKLPDEAELEIERLALSSDPSAADAENIGKASRIDDASGRYVEFLKNTFPREHTLDGLRIILDCANGAAYKVAPAVLRELGAEVFTIGTTPDGYNINDNCGSLHPENVANYVRERRADIGITLDGDADRLILVDEKGNIVNGDQTIALSAINLHAQGLLANATVVATIMSNIGLEIALKKHGIKLERSQVGDRYVVEKMRAGGFNLGGEQSGHLIFLDHTSTGDGMIAALQVLAIMKREDKPLSEIAKVMTSYPQVLINIPVSEKPPLDSLTGFQTELAAITARLGESGRVVVRYSGTEKKARVMVEGQDKNEIDTCAKILVDALQAEIGIEPAAS